MINLIRNEFTKLGKFKLIIPFLLFISMFFIEYHLNTIITFDNLIVLIPYIGIVLCIIFSGIVSAEVENGTFKYYLTKAKTRAKVLLSKIIMEFIYTFLLTVVLLILFNILGGYLNIQIILKYFTFTIPLYFIISLTTVLSIIIKNTPINSGMCIILLSFSGILSELLFKNNIKFIEYTFFPYLDLTIFNSSESINLVNLEYGINLNISYGVLINILFIILFNIVSFILFIKKDIKS